MAVCKYCGKEFKPKKTVPYQKYCNSECSRRYREPRYKEYKKIEKEKWRRENRDRVNETTVKNRRKVREEVLQHYGGKCEICGESHIECLTFDHINGDGNKHRKEINKNGVSFVYWLKNNGYPDDIRVLCWNCNCSIGSYGYSPYEKENNYE